MTMEEWNEMQETLPVSIFSRFFQRQRHFGCHPNAIYKNFTYSFSTLSFPPEATFEPSDDQSTA